MPRKGSAILISIWALVLLPALCMGGLIGHACDCASESDCRHEEACDDDPCGQLSAATPQRNQAFEVTLVHCVAEDVQVGSLCSHDASHCRSHRYSPTFQEVKRPFAPSDIPLLV